jgi:glutamyl-tRNA reductase
MNVQVAGCSHHGTSVAIRERLAFNGEQTAEALDQWRRVFRGVEAVLLSTCNRVEIYAAAETASLPTLEQVAGFLARFHKIEPELVQPHLYFYADEAAVRHLFSVAASMESMVLGEPQILAQVKQAYQMATERDTTGPLLHTAFQAAVRAARQVANQTSIHQRRLSVPSVAVGDFAGQIFQRFDDKQTLLVGGGEMAEETLRYLCEEGAWQVTIINRHAERAAELARRWEALWRPWEELLPALATADVVISTTGAGKPIVSLADFHRLGPNGRKRPLFILDLAVPRDFEPAIGKQPDVYLYSIDDLEAACQRNRAERDRELPAAMRLIQQETERFMADLYHRATGPVIAQLKQGWQKPKEEELARLLGRLHGLDERAQGEIRQSFDRLVNKLLHPPLESLRDESQHGIPHVLLEALSRLFQLKD